MRNYIWQTLGLSALAGFRSMTAPALLSHNLLKFRPPALAKSPLRLLQKPWVATGLKLMAAAEIIGDKHPAAPNRTAPPILTGRILSGALVGATLYKVQHQSIVWGAALGGLTAAAATFGSLFLRKQSAAQLGIPIAVAGGLEDVLVLGAGVALAKGSSLGSTAGRAL